jgi:hypothetical protein
MKNKTMKLIKLITNKQAVLRLENYHELYTNYAGVKRG